MCMTVMNAPWGPVGLDWHDGELHGLDLDPAFDSGSAGQAPAGLSRQLRAYFEDPGTPFDLPLADAGTAFQRRVWAAMMRIPPGQTRTYGELAAELGTSARAVGGACRANPCPIVVPCHRVVGKDGLGGFAGDRSGRKLAVKRWLLAHEGASLP